MEPVRHLFTADEYQAMDASGLFPPDQRLELIEGEVIEMAAIRPVHASVVDRLNQVLVHLAGDRAIVRVQNPVRLSDLSEPQPDLCLIRPRPDYYSSGHPGSGDILLAVEVGDTNPGWDRRVKMPLYSRSGVPELWLADVATSTLEVYRHPGTDGYASVSTFARGERLTLSEVPDVVVDIDMIFGAG